jgi:hypothetical protein
MFIVRKCIRNVVSINPTSKITHRMSIDSTLLF